MKRMLEGGFAFGVWRLQEKGDFTVREKPPCVCGMERVTGLEPANTSLGSWGLTTWQHPHAREGF